MLSLLSLGKWTPEGSSRYGHFPLLALLWLLKLMAAALLIIIITL